MLSCYGSSQVDSILQIINGKKGEIESINQEINELNKELIGIIKTIGYEIKIPQRYADYDFYTEASLNSEKLGTIKNGDLIKVYDKPRLNDLWYKVEYEGKVGYTQVYTSFEYPLSLLSNKEFNNSSTNGNSTHSSSSSKTNCSSVQCSGRTQSGSRCSRRTTNCSGRCYQH